MPSHVHESLSRLFLYRSNLTQELMQLALHIELPRYTDARIHSPDPTEASPVGCRADLMVELLNEGKPVLGIVVEIQLSIDPHKRYVWPAYAANLRAKLERPVHLMVVTPDDDVARWAAQPIDLGGGNTFAPLVVGPSNAPEIIDDHQAQANPQLAVLSAIVHGQDKDITKSARIAAVALRACSSFDTERAQLFVDVIHESLSEAARRELRDMQTCELQVPK